MRIGIDVDGVLAAFNEAFIELIKHELNIELPPVSGTYPDVWSYHRRDGVSAKQDQQLWNVIKTTPFWSTLHAMAGAPDAVRRLNALANMGNDVYFITSRPGALAKYYTEFWLRGHGMMNPTVLIAIDKGPIAEALNLNVFIDDKIENIKEVLMCAPWVKCYIVDAPYNQDVDWGSDSVTRIKTINGVLDAEFAPKQEARAA
jgi:uncharacterized HAD superfamily protein